MAEQFDHACEAERATVLQDVVFSAPNVLRADTFSSLEPALRWHRQGHGDRPVLLPFRAAGEDVVAWYACARTDAMARALSHEIDAFLGPSYVQTAPSDRSPDTADAHMLPPIARAKWQSIRLAALNPESEKAVQQQWLRYWRLLERRPIAASHVPQSFDQVRARFDRALAARHESGALAALATLRERFGLSAENRLFLDIRRDAAFGRWNEIAEHRLLHTIVHLRLPPETYGDVMEAIYEAEVSPFERAPRVEDLLDRFRETMAETAKPLFRTRRTSRRPAVLKAFVLYELAQKDPHAQACLGLLRELPDGAFGGLDAAVRKHVTQLTTSADFRAAQLAIDREQFDRGYELLWPLSDDAKVLQSLVLCARESDDPAKAAAVLSRLTNAASQIREAVEQVAPVRLQRLRDLAANQKVSEVAPLAEQFAQQAGESSDDYVERWRELARATLPDTVLRDPAAPKTAADCLTQLVLEKPDLFERLHPLWHELFVDRVDPDRRLMPIYVALLETLRARGDFSDADRGLLLQTLMNLVKAGPDPATYRSAVDEVHEVFKEVRSPHVIAWALDVCDALALSPTRDPDARMRLLLSVMQAAVEYQARLTSLERGLLRLLLSEAGVEVPPGLAQETKPEDGSTEPLTEGRLVAFYSLDESATKRATELLGDLFPRLKVERNADAVCTQRLKSLAQHADIFVFSWKSSKHAAYDCVKAAIRDKNRLVMASGGGTSSLVEAAFRHLS